MNFEVGEIVDGYRITGVLGRGGMGVVYKAEDTALSRDVALKVILANLTRDDEFIRRFQTEARTLAQVDSPYIVRIHALRETEAGWFIVMEYVEGGTVADLLEESESGLDVDTALPIIRQMFQAFDHAHGAGIIHRDIKPENVMLSQGGRVKIADFGLAKQSSPDTLATATQGMMGTLYYMSPEQVRGLGEADHRSDLWALGVVMYEMLTSRRPFKSTYEAAVLYSILNDEPEPITQKDGNIPRGLQDIIFRLLQKDQDARFQSARDVLNALDSISDGDTMRTRLATPPPSGLSSASSGSSVEDETITVAATQATSQAVESGADKSVVRRIVSTITLKRFLMGAVLVLGAAAAVFIFYGRTSDNTDTSSGDRYVTIETTPSDARILIEGSDAGRTPLERFETDGSGVETTVGIRKEGYADVDTVLGIGMRHSITLLPVPDDAPGGLPDDSPGQGDGTSNDTATGDGTSDDDETDQTETPAPPPRRGTLTVNVQPDGNVTLDGNSIEAGSPVDLVAGRHRININHVLYGELTHTVDVPAGGAAEVTCHLEGDVSVVSQPWGRIVIDGEVSEHVTDTVLQLPAGTYDIEVRKFGYEVEQTEGPEGPITITASCDERSSYRLVFQLTEQ